MEKEDDGEVEIEWPLDMRPEVVAKMTLEEFTRAPPVALPADAEQVATLFETLKQQATLVMQAERKQRRKQKKLAKKRERWSSLRAGSSVSAVGEKAKTGHAPGRSGLSAVAVGEEVVFLRYNQDLKKSFVSPAVPAEVGVEDPSSS
jgi:hypothetical protein